MFCAVTWQLTSKWRAASEEIEIEVYFDIEDVINSPCDSGKEMTTVNISDDDENLQLEDN